MHRQRKKDLNLKPNRSLDKRSSRGMIYENEELRLRTISINEEVDRSQNDVKKLKKENEHLKREIWSLRDEYEKLEDMLQKVCVQTNYDQSAFEPMAGYKPDRRVSVGGDTLLTSNFDSEEDEDGGSNILMIDEDGASMASQEDTQAVRLPLAMPEEDDSALAGNSDNHNVTPYQNLHRHSTWPHHHHHHSPELEVVREESENNSNSLHNASFCISPSSLVPVVIESDEIGGTFVNTLAKQLSSTTGCTPLIEITPASSPTPTAYNNTPTHDEMGTRTGNADIQDIGCVANVPKTFQVTSEIQISNEDFSKSQSGNLIKYSGNEDLITTNNQNEMSTSGVAALPPPSPGSKFKPSLVTKTKQRKIGISNNTILSKHSSSDNTAIAGGVLNPENPNARNVPVCRKHCPRRNSLVFVNHPSSNSGQESPVLGVRDCCPDFHCCYQSEPSLNSLGITSEEYFCASPAIVSAAFNGFDQSVCICHHQSHRHPQGQQNWNSIDKNVAIGILAHVNLELSAQEVIDELESQFDPTLENIAGVRMMPGTIFICLRSSTAVKTLLEKESVIVKGQKMKLFDASNKFSTVVLSGLPPDLSDLVVISTLNQFGQVVAPLERRIYKGVDISERICHMHLVKSLAPVLSIAGCEVRAKIVSQCQELSFSSGDNEKHEFPSTHAIAGFSRSKIPNSTTTTTSSHSNNTLISIDTNNKNRTQQPAAVCGNPKCSPNNTMNNIPGQPIISNLQKQELEPRLSLPLSTSNADPSNKFKQTNAIAQSVSTPTQLQSQSQHQMLKPHKPVVRSSSSAPRLETGPGIVSDPSTINASIMAKRHMSVCAGAGISPEDSARLSLNVNNNLPPNPKKPLSRLMKSSPGSLTPQTPNPTGLRRASAVSMQMHPNHGIEEQDPSSSPGLENNNRAGEIFSRGPSFNGNRMFAHNQSQISHRAAVPILRGGTGTGTNKSNKKEPLPWCGCWGNGCI